MLTVRCSDCRRRDGCLSECMLGYTPPVDRILDTRLWKHYLSATTLRVVISNRTNLWSNLSGFGMNRLIIEKLHYLVTFLKKWSCYGFSYALPSSCYYANLCCHGEMLVDDLLQGFQLIFQLCRQLKFLCTLVWRICQYNSASTMSHFSYCFIILR